MNALICIDYTYDFVADEGALTTGKAGQQIELALTRLTESFLDDGDFVVFAVDSHDPNDQFHPENKIYPPHNLIHSKGQQFFGKLLPLYQKYQHSQQVYYLPKHHYSAFCGTDLDLHLRRRKITKICLSGVCTDICILHTAIDAYNLGYQIVIHENSVASFDPVGHNWALNHMRAVLGATQV